MTSSGESPEPLKLSIVVGCRRSEVDPASSLQSLRGQLRHGVEVIVVDDGEGESEWGSIPGWTTLHARDALVPEMWAAGLAQARGALAAFTTGSVVAEPDWVDRLLEAGGSAAVGGAIEPNSSLTWVDWAVYFCRYTPYMLPLLQRDRLEIPGDNAVYRRDVLDGYRHLYRDAFWEPFVHSALRRDGYSLDFDAELVVRQSRGMSLRGFSRQRFRHGRAHGLQRSAGLGRARVMLDALTAPLVPLLLTARAGANVWRKRRHRVRFLAVTPVLLWFYVSWAVGELVGRIDAARGPR